MVSHSDATQLRLARLEHELQLERDANTALNAAMEMEVARLEEKTRATQQHYYQQQANLTSKLSDAEKKVSTYAYDPV